MMMEAIRSSKTLVGIIIYRSHCAVSQKNHNVNLRRRGNPQFTLNTVEIFFSETLITM
jgi:hypothetical protein